MNLDKFSRFNACFLQLMLILLTLTLLATVMLPLAGAYNWPKKGYDTINTACSPEQIEGFDPWNQTVSPSRGFCDPAIANDFVYVGSDRVYALNASSGTQVWNHTTADQWVVSVCVSNGMVYATSWEFLYAFNASTGDLLWAYSTGSCNNAPNVVDGVLYVGSLDHNVYALNCSTGVEIWRYTTGGGVSAVCSVVDGLVYFGSMDYNIYALNSSTGSKVWSYRTQYIVESVTLADGMVYAGSGDWTFYALNALTGELSWSFACESSPYTAAVVEGVVYFGVASGVYALNAHTGNQIWHYPTTRSVYTSPAVCDGAIYFADLNMNLFALDLDSGKEVWSITLSNYTSSPVIAGNSLFVGVKDGYVCSFYTLISIKVNSDNEAAFASQNHFFNYGDNMTLTFKAKSGYKITHVYIDSQDIGAISSYNFTNIQQSRNITVTTQALPLPPPTPTNSPFWSSNPASNPVAPEFSAVMLLPILLMLLVAVLIVKLVGNKTKQNQRFVAIMAL